MRAFLLSLLIVWIVFSCKKEPAKSPDIPTANLRSSETSSQEMCVGTKTGLKVRESSSLQGKELETLNYQTVVYVVGYGKTEKVGGKEYPWALIEYKGNTAWVYSGYLKVDCYEYPAPDPLPDKIKVSNILGEWKVSKESKYNISIDESGTFSVSLFGGCDQGGCSEYNSSGKWDLKDDLIYFYHPESREVHIYWLEKGRLVSDGLHNPFKENYGNDSVYNLERFKL